MLIPNKSFDGCYMGNVVKNNTKLQLGKKKYGLDKQYT
jgi:hypothetical protein